MAYTSRIPEIIAALEASLPRVVERAGLRVEAGAKQRARVDTGYMRGQIRWTPSADPFVGEVVGGADYTIYNEYGTSTMSAQPMFAPAAEENKPIFEAEVAEAIRKAIG
jgi:HK97 gp10 family phage protein